MENDTCFKEHDISFIIMAIVIDIRYLMQDVVEFSIPSSSLSDVNSMILGYLQWFFSFFYFWYFDIVLEALFVHTFN